MDLLTYRNNVETLRNRAQAPIRQGKGQAEVQQFMASEYKWSNTPNMTWGFPGLMGELQ